MNPCGSTQLHRDKDINNETSVQPLARRLQQHNARANNQPQLTMNTI